MEGPMTAAGPGRVVAFVRLSRPWFLLGPGLILFVGVIDSGVVDKGVSFQVSSWSGRHS